MWQNVQNEAQGHSPIRMPGRLVRGRAPARQARAGPHPNPAEPCPGHWWAEVGWLPSAHNERMRAFPGIEGRGRELQPTRLCSRGATPGRARNRSTRQAGDTLGTSTVTTQAHVGPSHLPLLKSGCLGPSSEPPVRPGDASQDPVQRLPFVNGVGDQLHKRRDGPWSLPPPLSASVSWTLHLTLCPCGASRRWAPGERTRVCPACLLSYHRPPSKMLF